MKFKVPEYIYLLTIFFLTFFSVWYFGFRSINPIDNFTNYNSGYLILNGQIPFKDYWVTTGPLLDFIQFLIFKILGVNWGSYVFHAAILNSAFAIMLYYIFKQFKLENIYCFVYSLLTGLIFYTQVSTPFVDHHASMFSILAILFLILGINFERKNVFWFFIPIFLILAFLSKQTPSSYFLLAIIIFSAYNFLVNRNFKNLIFSISSCLLIICILILIINLQKISFSDFFNQYIKFASGVGKIRLEVDGFLKPISFSRYFIKFKLMHVSYFLLLFYLIHKLIKEKYFYRTKDFTSILLLVFTTYILIIHQLLTLNVKFIYFYIPILCGFSHIYLKNFVYSKKLISINLVILFTCFAYYFSSYVYQQKFQLFCQEHIKINSKTKTKIIDGKFNFYWKSCLKEKSDEEVKNLKRIIEYLNLNINENYLLITDYQFINAKLKKNNNKQINKWYHPSVSYPLFANENFPYYKNFLEKKIKSNGISRIIFIYPSHFNMENQLFFENIFEKCLTNKKKLLDDLIRSINVEKCI